MATLETVVSELNRCAARFSIVVTEELVEIISEECEDLPDENFKRRMVAWRKSTTFPRLPTFAELMGVQLEPLPLKRLPEPVMTPEEEAERKRRIQEAIKAAMPKCLK